MYRDDRHIKINDLPYVQGDDLETILRLLHYIQPDVEELNSLAGSGINLAIKALKGADFKDCMACIEIYSARGDYN